MSEHDMDDLHKRIQEHLQSGRYFEAYPNGYRDGFVKGYRDGVDDGRIQGFQDAKRLAFKAVSDDADAVEALEFAIGEL